MASTDGLTEVLGAHLEVVSSDSEEGIVELVARAPGVVFIALEDPATGELHAASYTRISVTGGPRELPANMPDLIVAPGDTIRLRVPLASPPYSWSGREIAWHGRPRELGPALQRADDPDAFEEASGMAPHLIGPRRGRYQGRTEWSLVRLEAARPGDVAGVTVVPAGTAITFEHTMVGGSGRVGPLRPGDGYWRNVGGMGSALDAL